MIIWIASYPKSGNTWIRSLISAYFYSKDGKFNFKLLKNINLFSSRNFPDKFSDKLNYQSRISKNWIPAQKLINEDKKTHFFKTHNAICSINGNHFTDKLNTLAAIYVVRDPRNLISSISNHYEFSLEESFNFMTNKRKIIFPKDPSTKEKIKAEPEDFNFLGDWSDHYKSWKNIGFCPVKIIRYEDITKDARKIFVSTLEFLSQFIKFEFDKKKIDNAIKSTSFANLKQMEKKEGFSESVVSNKTKKPISFFNLGKKNNWKELLDDKIKEKIEKNFKEEMNELNYL
tara:strand:- start:1061 stop:1921 length:861 start_codon:yes stop_codon:yes gene_type:complete